MIDWLGIKGKVVIVTGGSSGIDRSIVKNLLAQEVYAANSDTSASETQHEYLLSVKADVTSWVEVEADVAQVAEKFGAVDGLINNARINIPRLLVNKDHLHGPYRLLDEVLDKIVAIDQKGLYLMSQAVGRILVQKQTGVIINMSSEAGLEGSERQSAHVITKAAVSSYTRSWAKKLGKSNARAVRIMPDIMEEAGLRTSAYEETLAYTRSVSVERL